MKLLILLLVLALRHLAFAWPNAFKHPDRVTHHFSWWWQWPGRFPPWLAWLIAVAIPSLLVAIIFQLLGEVAWGIGTWPLGLILLLYLLGPVSSFKHWGDIITLGELGDKAGVAHLAQEYRLAGKDEPLCPTLEQSCWQQSCQQLFAVIFWLIVLGYWAAFLYVVNRAYLRRKGDDAPLFAFRLHAICLYPVSRLLVLCLGLVSDFSRVTRAVAGKWLLLDANALLTLALDAILPTRDTQKMDEFHHQVKRLVRLRLYMTRALGCWLVIAAIWTLLRY